MRRLFVLLASIAIAATAQQDPKLFQELKWRSIGPFRGGRTVATVGIASQPNVF